MKTANILAGLSLLALSACNKAPETAAAPQAEGTATPGAATAASNWLETASKTAEGGMLMGNPQAAVKLIEYGALSCPHCAKFSADSREKLKEYVATGKVSYEFRTFLIHPQDVPASLLARCNGAGPFFAISEQMYDTQNDWLGKSSTISEADQKAWQAMTPSQVAVQMADKLGLVDFVKARGVGADKAAACLADKAGMDELEKIAKGATDQYQISGTPTFIINGQVVPDTTTWDLLEPALKAAGA
jgi:protein-disulfide isomerase